MGERELTSYHFRDRQHHADSQHATAKHDACDSWNRPPTPRTQLHVTQWRKDVCQCTRTRGANELEHRTQITCDQAYGHCTYDQGTTEDQMSVWVIGLIGKPVIVHNFSTNEGFEGQCGEHVKAKAEACNLHHEMALRGKVVEDVAFGKGAESEEAGKGHGKAGDERDEGAVVRYGREAVEGRCAEGAVNQERVMVADEC